SVFQCQCTVVTSNCDLHNVSSKYFLGNDQSAVDGQNLAADEFCVRKVAFHYPPLFAPTEQTLFTDLMEKYNVKDCVYGHIHGENHLAVFEEERSGVQYKLVSCDTQGFKLYKIV
ncbi:MAG: hypothetical protein IJ947_00770, partial [Phascolarctobacterium sp.]|nr:hypothetical protein [Phascolarctobacterium sp.]